MSKVIKILGTGCKKCKQAEEIVTKVLAKHNIEAKVEKVEDLSEIMSYSVMNTPAVVVDEIVKITGRVPNEKEILKAIE